MPGYQEKKTRDMSGYVWPAIGAGLMGIVLSNIIGTQYIASSFGYQDALGAPLFSVAGISIYMPFDWALWAWQFRSIHSQDVQTVFENADMILMISHTVAVLIAFGMMYLRSRKPKGESTLHGSAHWATPEEIEETGLLGKYE